MPYIHIFLYHVPGIIERLGRRKSFSGQEVEKNNDDAKIFFFIAAATRQTQAMISYVMTHGTTPS